MLALIPIWSLVANRNKYTRQVLYSGWTPVVSAMAISSFGGCILDFAVSRFRGIAVFQPVINGKAFLLKRANQLSNRELYPRSGVGGNLIAVQASRLSTYLHQRYRLGDLDKKEREFSWSPMKTFFANSKCIVLHSSFGAKTNPSIFSLFSRACQNRKSTFTARRAWSSDLHSGH